MDWLLELERDLRRRALEMAEKANDPTHGYRALVDASAAVSLNEVADAFKAIRAKQIEASERS